MSCSASCAGWQCVAQAVQKMPCCLQSSFFSSKNGIVKGSVIETHQRSTEQGNTLTGSDITITSGSDLQLQTGKLKGDNVTLTSAGTTYLDAGLNSQYDQIDKNKTGLATVKMQGSGTTRQTVSLTQIDSQHVTINALI